MSLELDVPLADAEYDELGEMLLARAVDEQSMLLDALQGMLTAIAIGPEAVPPDEWIGNVIDDGSPFDSVAQAERAISLVLRLFNSITSDLEELRYEPILGSVETEGGDTTLSAQGWCEGFSLGVDLRSAIWETRMRDDPRLMDILEPILVLSADEGVFEHEIGEEPAPLSESEYEAALGRLATAVYDVQQYWRDHPPHAPFAAVPREEAPKTRGIPRRRGGRSVH